jgi:hypothetical protein
VGDGANLRDVVQRDGPKRGDGLGGFKVLQRLPRRKRARRTGTHTSIQKLDVFEGKKQFGFDAEGTNFKNEHNA